MMTCHTCDQLLMDALEDTLSSAQQAEWQAHLAAHAECQRNFDAARESLHFVRHHLPQQEPSAALDQRIMTAAQEALQKRLLSAPSVPDLQPKGFSAWLASLFAMPSFKPVMAFCAIAVVVGSTYFFQFKNNPYVFQPRSNRASDLKMIPSAPPLSLKDAKKPPKQLNGSGISQRSQSISSTPTVAPQKVLEVNPSPRNEPNTGDSPPLKGKGGQELGAPSQPRPRARTVGTHGRYADDTQIQNDPSPKSDPPAARLDLLPRRRRRLAPRYSRRRTRRKPKKYQKRRRRTLRAQRRARRRGLRFASQLAKSKKKRHSRRKMSPKKPVRTVLIQKDGGSKFFVPSSPDPSDAPSGKVQGYGVGGGGLRGHARAAGKAEGRKPSRKASPPRGSQSPPKKSEDSYNRERHIERDNPVAPARRSFGSSDSVNGSVPKYAPENRFLFARRPPPIPKPAARTQGGSAENWRPRPQSTSVAPPPPPVMARPTAPTPPPKPTTPMPVPSHTPAKTGSTFRWGSQAKRAPRSDAGAPAPSQPSAAPMAPAAPIVSAVRRNSSQRAYKASIKQSIRGTLQTLRRASKAKKPGLYLQLATLYLQSKRQREAKYYFQRYIDSLPLSERPSAYERVAQIYRQYGHHQMATQMIQRLIRQYPNRSRQYQREFAPRPTSRDKNE